jgi:excisionase family DNA binding protein
MTNTLSVRATSERYEVSEQTVLGWIHRGELRAINVGRRPGAKKPRWRITQAALDAFEALRTPTPPPPRTRRRRQRPAEVIEFYETS